MGKHEIRLRRQRMTARGSERYRNYSAILKQHGEARRMKMITRIFTFVFLIIALIIIFIVVSRWEKRQIELEKQSSKFSISHFVT